MPREKIYRVQRTEIAGKSDLLIVKAKASLPAKAAGWPRFQVSKHRRMLWLAKRLRQEIESGGELPDLEGSAYLVQSQGSEARFLKITVGDAEAMARRGGELYRVRFEHDVVMVEPVKPITSPRPRPSRKRAVPNEPSRKTEQGGN